MYNTYIAPPALSDSHNFGMLIKEEELRLVGIENANDATVADSAAAASIFCGQNRLASSPLHTGTTTYYYPPVVSSPQTAPLFLAIILPFPI
jgi:hypothetical protein